MKKKIISSTYLRDVDKYQIKIFLDEDDYYLSIKKLISVKKKFIIKNNICVMDNNYYIIEVVPKNENYAMRLFLDDKFSPLEFYFDVCKNNGLYENTNIPCYDDLYLDITYLCSTGQIEILDEDELLEGFKLGIINCEELNNIYKEKDKILNEIKSNTNKYMNLDFKKYLENF